MYNYIYYSIISLNLLHLIFIIALQISQGDWLKFFLGARRFELIEKAD